ncbi:MAG: hypothetical protein GKC09_11975 [Methanosarcinales archaeon]|nr:hypothetical protein [Methanosarcinales archaeon]
MGMHARGMMISAPLNVTSEELGNMTLGEIKELEKSALNSSLEEKMPFCGRMNARGGEWMDFRGASPAGSCGFGISGCGFTPISLMDDVTSEELGEMSLNQILDLYDQKTDELESMTLNEIRDQWKTKVEAQNNMTINELVDEAKDMQAKEGIINWVSIQYRRLMA